MLRFWQRKETLFYFHPDPLFGLVFSGYREPQESYTGGNSKEAVQPALARRSSGVLECIQCTPISEAPA